jgi:hypothetical protein
MGHGHAYGGIGMMGMVEVVEQLNGQAGDYQVTPLPKVGLVETMGARACAYQPYLS